MRVHRSRDLAKRFKISPHFSVITFKIMRYLYLLETFVFVKMFVFNSCMCLSTLLVGRQIRLKNAFFNRLTFTFFCQNKAV